MVCFVCLDNNVLRGFAECVCVYLGGTKALFSQIMGYWKIANRLQIQIIELLQVC